jgi:hypothetical protein
MRVLRDMPRLQVQKAEVINMNKEINMDKEINGYADRITGVLAKLLNGEKFRSLPIEQRKLFAKNTICAIEMLFQYAVAKDKLLKEEGKFRDDKILYEDE